MHVWVCIPRLVKRFCPQIRCECRPRFHVQDWPCDDITVTEILAWWKRDRPPWLHSQQTTEKRPTFPFVLGFMWTGMAETAQCVAGEWEKTHLESRSLNRPAGMWVCKWKQFSNNKCCSPGIRIKRFTLRFHEDLTTFSVAARDGYHSIAKNKTTKIKTR